MNLTGLLAAKGIEPKEVLVLRHRPTEPRLNDVIPWLAAEKPDVFNAYRQTQGEKLEKAMTDAKYVASLVASRDARSLSASTRSAHRMH